MPANSTFKTALLILCILIVLIAGFIAPSGDYFFANFLGYCIMLFVPMALLLLFFNPRLDIVFAGTLAIIVVFLLERHWEVAIYKGPNSMPFVIYVIVCAPLTIVGSCIAYWTCKMLKRDKSWLQVTSTLGLGIAFGVSAFIKEYF